MAYEKKTWKNRQSEYPNRRTLTPVDGQENTYDVARAEGLVMEEGDAFDQKTMQDLEDRVAAGFAAVTSRTYTAVLPAEGYPPSTMKSPNSVRKVLSILGSPQGISLAGSLCRS